MIALGPGLGPGPGSLLRLQQGLRLRGLEHGLRLRVRAEATYRALGLGFASPTALAHSVRTAHRRGGGQERVDMSWPQPSSYSLI